MPEPLEEATELIHEIGGRLLADETYNAHDWEAVALVAVMRSPTAMSTHGYLYLRDGRALPEIPGDPAMFDLLRDFAEATARPDGKQWKTAIVHVHHDTRRMQTQMEWDDADRWQVTPLNFKTMPDALRPDFSKQ